MTEIMIISGLSESLYPDVQSKIRQRVSEGIVVPWAYVFQDFRIWGDYFKPKVSDDVILACIKFFHELGFKVGFYVDVGECTDSIIPSLGVQDSILQAGWVNQPYWQASRMTLNPNKSWSKYLRAGMTALLEKYPIDGFNIDRADVVGMPSQLTISGLRESKWLCQLLDEVRRFIGSDIQYVCNSLWQWQTLVARRAYFLGSDGVKAYEDSPSLVDTIDAYKYLAQFSSLHKCYINPTDGTDEAGDPNANRLAQWKNIMKHNDFTFFDPWNFQDIDTVLSYAVNSD